MIEEKTDNVDLSGVDWSQIPLDQVEKVEVIRGGQPHYSYIISIE